MKKMKSNNTTNTAYIVFKHNTSDYYVVDKEIYENTFYARREKYTIVFEVEYTEPKMKFGFTPVKNKPYNQNVQPLLDEVGIK